MLRRKFEVPRSRAARDCAGLQGGGVGDMKTSEAEKREGL